MLTNGVDLKWLKTRSETHTQLTKVLQLTYNFVNKSSHVEWITYKIQLYGKNKTHLICRPSFDFFFRAKLLLCSVWISGKSQSGIFYCLDLMSFFFVAKVSNSRYLY